MFNVALDDRHSVPKIEVTAANLDFMIREMLPPYLLNPMLADCAACYSIIACELPAAHGQICEYNIKASPDYLLPGSLEEQLSDYALVTNEPPHLKHALEYILMFLCTQNKIHPGRYIVELD